jgi:Tfp pilus assembly protein PilZ
MLVRCQDPIAVGSEVRLAVSLPKSTEPVQAKAEVVRQTDPNLESGQGLGLKFIEFEGQGKKALVEYLNRHSAESQD